MKAIATFELETEDRDEAEDILTLIEEELDGYFAEVTNIELELELAVPWVTMGPGPHFATCQRCGEHEPPPRLPCPLSAMVAYLGYVQARHRDCQEPAL